MLKNKRFFRTAKANRALLLLPFILIVLLFIIIPLFLIIYKSFAPVDNLSFTENWAFIDNYIWGKILQSFLIALLATIICIGISYPFAMFLTFNIRSKNLKAIVVVLVTAPIWMSFLVKIVGLKTTFDLINGTQNSTFGDIYTVIGLVYIYLPFMILPLYNVLSEMPKNLIFASKDLGRSNAATFFYVILPYTFTALAAGVTLVFLPALTTVAVPQFMNGSSSGSMIGDIIMGWGADGQTNELSLARASTLSLVILLLILISYLLYVIGIKIYKKTKNKWFSRGIA